MGSKRFQPTPARKHRTAMAKVRHGMKVSPVEAKRRLLAEHPELRPGYQPPPVEPHPVKLLMERELAQRPVDPIWDPWDPMSP